ncbi:hypothetical protein FPQ18DRAFT_424746 [Pyronema domesticum]|nr:hypothetical protein FPQ18DRAFT_424746 [Pyronema domesticum]
MYMMDWWSCQQLKKPAGSMIVPVIGSCDQTHTTNYARDGRLWPVYISLGNIDTSFQCKKSDEYCILLALLPVPPKYTFKGKGSTAALKLQQEYTQTQRRPLKDGAENEQFMRGADGQISKCFPVVNAWIDDYMENVGSHSITSLHCPVCDSGAYNEQLVKAINN